MNTIERGLLFAGIAVLCAFRFAHLGGPLDTPMWRQTDTAYMAVRMMRESPPDMLRPKAPYRGTNDVKAAEFPIYPALAALAYKALDRESLSAARIVTLIFFAGSAWLFFLCVRLFAGSRVAGWATLFYCAAPLGIVYSRMVHPDYAIVFFSHLFLYGLLRFVRDGRWAWWGVALLGGVGAFLMKAPYAFYLGLLPGWWWLADRERRTLGRFIGLATVLVVPLGAAVWFNEHRIALEAPFEESLVYPMKWTADSSAGRFFGGLADRMDLDGWKLLVRRMLWLVLTPVGILLTLIGMWPRRPHGESPDRPFATGFAWMPQVWLAGAALYALLVFPMVVGPHEYYTIPLIAAAAVLAAVGAVRVVDGCRVRFGWAAPVTAALLMILLGAGIREGLAHGPYRGRTPYFSIDWQRVAAGEAIRAHTRPDALVVSVTHGRSTGWSDPRILYHADRLGWCIEARSLTDEILARYIAAGATVAAVLVTPEAESREDELGPLAGKPHDAVPLQRGGEEIGSLRLYMLGAAPEAAP